MKRSKGRPGPAGHSSNLSCTLSQPAEGDQVSSRASDARFGQARVGRIQLLVPHMASFANLVQYGGIME